MRLFLILLLALSAYANKGKANDKKMRVTYCHCSDDSPPVCNTHPDKPISSWIDNGHSNHPNDCLGPCPCDPCADNEFPDVVCTYDQIADAGDMVVFNCTETTDPENDPLLITASYGDGDLAASASGLFYHEYDLPVGTSLFVYTAEIVVKDLTCNHIVTVPLEITILKPSDTSCITENQCDLEACDGAVYTNSTSGNPLLGQCRPAIYECIAGSIVNVQTEVLPSVELCDSDYNDENCNGTANEGFNLGMPCSIGLGKCLSEGVYVCKADQTGSECNALVIEPNTEICDGLDNNCNGLTDELWDFNTDLENCGGCGIVVDDNVPCTVDTCSIGVVVNTPVVCDPGQLCDNGVCVTTSTCTDVIQNGDETDVDCGGSCPNACPDSNGCLVDNDCISNTCSNGVCCPAGQESCGGVCFIPNGACPSDGTPCTDPSLYLACEAPTLFCDNTEIKCDIFNCSDPVNAGQCFIPGGYECNQQFDCYLLEGYCVENTDCPYNSSCCGNVCPFTDCVSPDFDVYIRCGECGNTACTNILSDNNNCGACGNVCPAGTECSGSECVPIPGYCVENTDCPYNSSCCGNVCPSIDCISSIYAVNIRCGECGNTACTNIFSNNNNCGACGNVCPAGTECSGSECVPIPGYCVENTDCPYNAPCCGNVCPSIDCISSIYAVNIRCGECGNTACTNIFSNNNNCGACGNVCAATHTCSNGVCCPAGQESCGGVCFDPNIACSDGTPCTDPNIAPVTTRAYCDEQTSTIICQACNCTTDIRCDDGAGNQNNVTYECNAEYDCFLLPEFCLDATDCAADQNCCDGQCSNYLCPSPCTSGADCASNQFCDPYTNECLCSQTAEVCVISFVSGVCPLDGCPICVQDVTTNNEFCGSECNNCTESGQLCSNRECVDPCTPESCTSNTCCSETSQICISESIICASPQLLCGCDNQQCTDTTTDISCGSSCDNLVDCTASGRTCSNGFCVATPTCSDGIQNQDETDVDCGGSCPNACSTCGNGIVEPGEECDDGIVDPNDGCDSNCKYSVCNFDIGPFLSVNVDCGDFGFCNTSTPAPDSTSMTCFCLNGDTCTNVVATPTFPNGCCADGCQDLRSTSNCGSCGNVCEVDETCGNRACAKLLEICGDNIDNDGDGYVDEFCGSSCLALGAMCGDEPATSCGSLFTSNRCTRRNSCTDHNNCTYAGELCHDGICALSGSNCLTGYYDCSTFCSTSPCP